MQIESSCMILISGNRNSGIVVSVLASSAVDRGFEPGQVKPKTMKFVFVAFLLSTQH